LETDPVNEPNDDKCPENEHYPVVRNEKDFYSFIESRLREDGLELFETSPRENPAPEAPRP
jgi:hypothetical protein